jgi:hypothetical protein
MEPIDCSETSVTTNLHCVTSKNSEDLRRNFVCRAVLQYFYRKYARAQFHTWCLRAATDDPRPAEMFQHYQHKLIRFFTVSYPINEECCNWNNKRNRNMVILVLSKIQVITNCFTVRSFSLALPSGRPVCRVGLPSLAGWGCGFESYYGHGYCLL